MSQSETTDNLAPTPRCDACTHGQSHRVTRRFASGSFATELGCPGHVRFTPVSDRTADIANGPVGATSRLMHRTKCASFDHLVSTTQQRNRDGDAERLRGSHIDNKFNLGGLLHGQISWLLALENSAGIEAG
jgi:hypothetical protein